MRRVVHAKRGIWRRNCRGNFLMDLKCDWLYNARKYFSQNPLKPLTDINRFPRPEFEQNLRSLIGICRAHEIPIVLLTQPSIFRSDLGEYEKSLLWLAPGGKHYSPGDMALLLNRFNDCTRRVAKEQNVPLIDLSAQLPRDTSVFYDDCHPNTSGCSQVAEIIAAALLDLHIP
jgi:hypothetical protein